MPEVFQSIEVVSDDFVVVGYGDTLEEANEDHDKILIVFLQMRQNRGLKLNTDKLKLRIHRNILQRSRSNQ